MTALPQDEATSQPADIAAENVRLRTELAAALARQTATSEILRVISGSPTDVQPVFEAIVRTAARLFRCDRAFIQRCDGVSFWTVTSEGPDGPLPITQSTKSPIDPDANFPSRAIVTQKTLHLPDWSAIELPEFERHIRELHGTNAALYMPLLREGECIGLLSIIGKQANMFGPSEIALAESFRDQALIAIENTRLFNETREALERQTATSDILKVIASSPSDVQPVFDVIVERAVQLCGGRMGRVYRYDDGMIHMVAGQGLSLPGLSKVQEVFPRPAADDTTAGLVTRSRQANFVTDIETDSVPALSRQMIEALGTRSQVTVPMLRKGEPIGAITVGWTEPGAYGDHQVALLQTFADQAVIAIENVRLFNETREALERQTATADILKVIASSPSNVQPVFEAIAESAKRLLGGHSALVTRVVDDMIHLAAFTTENPAGDKALQSAYPSPLSSPDRIHSKVARIGQPASHTDFETDLEVPLDIKEVARVRGYRSIVVVPMLREGISIGTIGVTRREPGPFSSSHIDLLKTFADQAVIAIENARLFNETREALERQTATSDILKVIASSPSDVQPVFEAIATSANRLLGGLSTAVHILAEDTLHLVAFTPTNPVGDANLQAAYPRPLPTLPWGTRLRNGEIVPVGDTEVEWSALPAFRDVARMRGFRSILRVPLLRDGSTIGVINVTRKEPGPFAAHHVQLLQTFADQAVIAVQNVRLFNETREALERQTATAEVLRVIASSPTDVKPVLDAIVESACKLCEASDSYVALKDGDDLVFQTHHGSIPVAWKRRPINRQWPAGRAVVDGKSIHLRDVLAREGNEFPDGREIARHDGARSVLTVPLMREGGSIGVIILRRTEVLPFTDKQIALLQTFADQAVIAIENVRLFDEVQAKTRDLTEALTYQTGSSNILKVIASSPTDVGPVLAAIAENAAELCDAYDAAVVLQDGGDLRFCAHHGSIPIGIDKWPINRNWTAGRAFLDRKPVHLHDLRADENADFSEGRELSLRMGHRSILSVPLLRENESIGAIVLRRLEVHPFNEKQITLLQTFADQAVIAIGNVRLFEQVQERTRELSQSLDELRTAQDRLVQTEKLASLGQLTAGIAHEIKNPLNFVNNFSSLSAELVDELNDVLKPAALNATIRQEIDELTKMLKDNLEKVVQHGKRADSIVKNMLLHSREGSGDHRPADINALLDESLNLAYHGARAEKPQFNVTLQRDFDATAGTIEVFPQEITRVFLNLISNGFYAVTKRKTENGNPDFEPVLSAATKNLGNNVEVRIRDNGTGIPAEVKEKMFNPFFTTKPAGEGTGLGLSMSHDIIVKQHGGTIDVETKPGEFTEFRIVLPRTSKSQEKLQEKLQEKK
jgi:two-component system NtrC family sensor kinase